MGRIQVTVAAIAVIAIASLAMNIAILVRSGDGAGSSNVSQGAGALGAQLGAATAVTETARLTLETPERATRGTARLILSIGGAGSSFRATAQVKGRGLARNGVYGMWLTAPDGKTLLITTARVRREENDDRVVNLRSSSQEVPFSITTLEGLTVIISEDTSGRRSTITQQVVSTAPSPLATATVSAADIS